MWIRMGKKILSSQICTSNLWKHVCTLSPTEKTHKNLNAFLRKLLGHVWGTWNTCLSLRQQIPKHSKRALQSLDERKACIKELLSRMTPGLAPRREQAHDPACFSSFSCWNANCCSIFSRQTLDRWRNATGGIKPDSHRISTFER